MVPVTFTMPPSYREAWDAEAASRGIGRSELLRLYTAKIRALADRLGIEHDTTAAPRKDK